MDMEIKVENEKENKMLNRKELQLHLSYEQNTPSREEVKKEVCKKFNLSPDSTEIVAIEQQYGSRSSMVTVHSYSSKELLQAMLKKKGKKRDGAAKEDKAHAKAADGKKEEKKDAEKK